MLIRELLSHRAHGTHDVTDRSVRHIVHMSLKMPVASTARYYFHAVPRIKSKQCLGIASIDAQPARMDAPQAGPGLPLANLAALILQTLFYGMYFVIFNISMYLLFMKAKGSGKYTPVMKSVVFISGFALFFTVTVVREIVKTLGVMRR